MRDYFVFVFVYFSIFRNKLEYHLIGSLENIFALLEAHFVNAILQLLKCEEKCKNFLCVFWNKSQELIFFPAIYVQDTIFKKWDR